MLVHGVSNLTNYKIITPIEKGSFFYVSREEKIIPWYNIFPYYFYVIDDTVYVNDFEFRDIQLDAAKRFILKHQITNFTEMTTFLNNQYRVLYLDKVLFIKMIHTNAGHALGNLLYVIYHTKNCITPDTNIVVTEDFVQFSPFLMSIIYLFYEKDKIIIINDKTIVHFNQSFITRDHSYKEAITTNHLIEKLMTTIIENPPQTMELYENICLIKTYITKNQNPANKTFCSEYIRHMEDTFSFKMIIPEKYDILTLFTIIHSAKNVILSWGCCSYLNSIFVHPNANVLVLCHEGYKNEYVKVRDTYSCGILNSGWFPEKAKNKYILYDLPSQLNDTVKQQLNNEVNKMVELNKVKILNINDSFLFKM